MTADAYLHAGGVSRVPSGEDQALIKALKRIDAAFVTIQQFVLSFLAASLAGQRVAWPTPSAAA
jgi:hypothetical protein